MARRRATTQCPQHDHPQLLEAVSEDDFRSELREIMRMAGLSVDVIDRADISFPDNLEDRHRKDPRAYAEVQTEDLRFRFAPQARSLPSANRLGLMAHEIGHLLDPAATENGADAAAETALDVRIVYDTRWPGKGLQKLLRLR